MNFLTDFSTLFKLPSKFSQDRKNTKIDTKLFSAGSSVLISILRECQKVQLVLIFCDFQNFSEFVWAEIFPPSSQPSSILLVEQAALEKYRHSYYIGTLLRRKGQKMLNVLILRDAQTYYSP